MNITYTESMGNFVLADMGPNAGAIYQDLLARGVILRYGATWGLPNHIRVSVGTLEENLLFLHHLREVMSGTGNISRMI